MPWANATTPNLADYTTFIYSVVAIPALNLPLVTANLASLSWAAGTVTATVAAPLPYIAGGLFSTTIAASALPPSGFDGSFVASLTTSTTFTYPLASNPGAPAAVETFTLPQQVVLDTLAIAMEIVNPALAAGTGYGGRCAPAVAQSGPSSPTVYVYAVYNLAMDRLANFAMDVGGQTFFKDMRRDLRLNDLSIGVTANASDQGTSGGWLNPEQMKMFTLADLQTLKSPWGRAYVGFAQKYGQVLWGLS